MSSMSLADQATFAQIISQVGAAPWVPFDSTAAEILGGIAVRVGFVATVGDWMLKIAAAPTATLLEFVIYAAAEVTLDT